MVIQAFNPLDDEIRQKSISTRAEHYSEYNKKERKEFVVEQKFAFAVSCAISYNLNAPSFINCKTEIFT